MKQLMLEMQNCHGIRGLKSTLDFHDKTAIAIYAPNGAMKTSLAKTFQDLKQNRDSLDGVFPERTTVRIVQDENGQDVPGSDVVVVLSYDEELGPTEATSTLLVNQVLRKEYESLQEELFKARDELVAGIKAQAGTRQDVSKLISRSFTKEDDNFFVALSRIDEELTKQTDAPFSEVPYDTLFNEKVRAIAETAEFGTALTEYVTRLNDLLDKSVFFSRNTFSYYNASNVTKSLGDNKYFQANHTLTLRGTDGKQIEVTNAKQLDELVTEEQQRITEDEVLRKKLLAIKKQLERSAETRAFYEYVAEHVEILPELNAFNLFEDKVWKSYLKAQEPLYAAVVNQWRKNEKRKDEIEKQAAAESTQWERVIEMFNDRFFVPFRLTAKNRERVVLALENMLQLGFEFEDGSDRATVDKGELLEVLSNGEKKALYILNVLFEVEARKMAKTETLFVIDDLADSFDYKNKYAIIQYLHEMAEIPEFKLVILTHNFDFFRTLNSRGIAGYNNCLTAQRTSTAIELVPASGIKNPEVDPGSWTPS
ncbi:MAG: phage infection protein [Acidimicrobiales bacterium]